MFRINPFSLINPRIRESKKISETNPYAFEETSLIEKPEKWEGHDKNSLKKQPKWNLGKLPLAYYIAKEPAEKFNSAVSRSFKSWFDASEGLITFEKTDSEENADIIINWSNEKLPGRDYEVGQNDLKVVNNRIEKAFITIITFPEIDGGLSHDARIERVRRTALHEIGHALGLNHSNNSKDVMFHRGIKNKNLSVSDITRLTEHYSGKSFDITT